MFLRSVAVAYDRLQAAASGGAARDGNPRAHAPVSAPDDVPEAIAQVAIRVVPVKPVVTIGYRSGNS